MNKKIFIILASIFAIFFLAAQTCSLASNTDCVGTGDIVCDDTEAYECELASYGSGYYLSRASEYDVSDCGATEAASETDLSSYETAITKSSNQIGDIEDEYSSLETAYASASAPVDYITIKRQLISLGETLDAIQTKLDNIAADLADEDQSNTGVTDLETTVTDLQTDADTLATEISDLIDTVQSTLDGLRTACTSADEATVCSGYACGTRGYCKTSCISSSDCDEADGYSCSSNTCISSSATLTALCSVSTTSATTSDTITFDGSGSTGTITSYSWDLGDGSGTSTDASVAYSYSVAADYTAKLTVSDGSTTATDDCDTVTITAATDDADGDGMPDEWEDTYGFDKNDSTDASEDADGDGATNLEEYKAGTNPLDENSMWYTTTSSLNANCGGTYEGSQGDTITLDASSSTGTVTQYCTTLYPNSAWISSAGPSYPADYEITSCTAINDVSEISFDHTFTYSGNYLFTLLLYGSSSSEYSFCSTNIDISCSSDADCYYNGYCESGACVECNAGSDCDTGYVCNTDYSCELDSAADADADGVTTGVEELLGFDPEDDNDLDSYRILMMDVDDNTHANIAGTGYISNLISSPYDTGMVTGNVALSNDGTVGDYVDFSDTTGDDHVDFASSGSTDYDFTSWFIMTAKIKPSADDLTRKSVIAMRSASSGCWGEYGLSVEEYVPGSAYYYGRLQKADGTLNYVFGGVPSATDWQEVTFVYSAANQKIYLYVDGEYKSSRTVTSVGTPSGKGFVLGGNPDCASLYDYNGGLDYLKIWGE